MIPKTMHSSSGLATTLLAVSASLCSFACGGSSSSSSGSSGGGLRSTELAVAGSAKIAIGGRYLAYVADEATTGTAGTFLNRDNDKTDAVVSLVNMQTQDEENLAVAVTDIEWAGATLFMAVNETQDQMDWDGDGSMSAAEVSLLYWRAGVADQPTFVASMDPAGPAMVAVGGRLFFSEEPSMPQGAGSTSLRVIEEATPDTPIPVGTDSPAAAGLHPRVIGEDEGLVFLARDEDRDGELNGDGDDDDETVLALISGLSSTELVRVTGLALHDDDAPLRALDLGGSDWLVAFLVDEEAHIPTPDVGFTGFNDPALFAASWRPLQCTGPADTDRGDEVLHYIRFAEWVSDPGLNPPRNTGLVGEDRIVAVDRYVGTISDEDDDRCDLNGDGNQNDRVFRWVEAVGGTDPILPPGDENTDLIALVDSVDIPGGIFGVAELEGRFVALFSENEDETDYDGDPATDLNLLAWLDPAVGGGWEFDHGTGTPFFGGATWMAETPERDRLLVAAPEEVFDTNLNIPSGASGPDNDKNDSIPSFNRFTSQGRLVFDIVRVAVDKDDAGMSVVDGVGFYRVNELQDARDWNGDGDLDDQVLFATTSSQTGFVSVLNDVPGSPAVVVEEGSAAPYGAAFIARESMDRRDYNGDGDETDFVVRYFRL